MTCTSPIWCLAVGESDTGLAYKPSNYTFLTLAERWNGSTWTILKTPRRRPPAESQFNGVACVSETSCIAVGGSSNFSSVTPDRALPERWNGTKWITEVAPIDTIFSSVSCPSYGICVGVGGPDTQFNLTFATKLTGTKWTITPTPTVAPYPALLGVSCVSPTTCISVGFSNNSQATDREPLAEKWNGAVWIIERAPVP